jgi:hypothetical protein
MTDSDERLSKVERRLLDELLTFRAALPVEPPPEVGQPTRRRPARKRRGRRLQIAAVAVAWLALAVVIAVHELLGSTTTLAATPKPLAYRLPTRDALSGRQELLSLAAAAAHQPASAITHPRYAYTKTMGWYLGTRVDGQATTSTIIPSTTQRWVAPDGRAHVHRVTRRPDGSRSVDDFTAAGKGPVPVRLSTNEAVLARQLAVGHPFSDGPVEKFVALTDLAALQPIPPCAESAILRFLARIPGLINQGSVIDRAGRHGIAVALDSNYSGLLTRYSWIFDRHTGALLGTEEMLIDPGKLHVRSGSIIAYTTFLTSGWTSTASNPPKGQS